MFATRLRAMACGIVALGIVPAAQGQQSAPTPADAHADSAFQQRSWQSAADAYAAIARTQPDNGMAWFRLATSLDQLHRSKEAIDAYDHAVRLGFQRARADYRLAVLYATSGDSKNAMDHLTSAAPMLPDPTMLDKEPAFASLRTSPEFAAVKQKAEAARYPCRSDHTFDFWVGDFSATPWNQPNAPSGGTLHNTREYDGCVIVERWTGTANGGMSMAFYDKNRKAWRMIWNDDSNSSNDFEGSYQNGAMEFNGWVLDAAGHKLLAKNVLQNVSPDVIRHIYSTSSDGGATWVVQSDGRFTRQAK